MTFIDLLRFNKIGSQVFLFRKFSKICDPSSLMYRSICKTMQLYFPIFSMSYEVPSESISSYALQCIEKKSH